MSCSPCMFYIPNCTTQQSRPQSVCSRPCSRSSSPCSRSSSPCSRPSSACRSYVCCYPCTPCTYEPCPPCGSTATKRKEKISDFIGSGVGAGPEPHDGNKRKGGRGGGKDGTGKDGTGRYGRKGKGGVGEDGDDDESGEGGEGGRGGGRAGKGGGRGGKKGGGENGTGSDDEGDGTEGGGPTGKSRKRKGGGQGEDQDEDDMTGGGKGGRGKGGRESGKGGLGGSQDDPSKVGAYGGAGGKIGYADIGVCTPRLNCPCPNPYCPSNLRKLQGPQAYSYAPQMYSQSLPSKRKQRLKCYCKGDKNGNPCCCKKTNDVKLPEVPKKGLERCPKCGKKKRLKTGGNSPQCGDNYSAYYVKNENFTAQSGLSSQFPKTFQNPC